MAAKQAPSPGPETRFLEPVVRPIVKATDLGNVQVLKQANLYLLTDQFGDVHPDARGLGLYQGDTRRLSCSILRVGGQRPVLLQASAGGTTTARSTTNGAWSNPRDKVRPEEALETQKLGIGRQRTLAGDVLEERVRIVNYAEAEEDVSVELELAADAADIFEVRGWTRAERGRHLPIAMRADRVTFRYDGLDGTRRSTHVLFSEPTAEAGPVDAELAGSANAGWIHLSWTWRLASGEARELGWVVWTTDREAPSATPVAATGEPEEVLFPAPPRLTDDAVAASYHA
jgi:hypothetical protein